MFGGAYLNAMFHVKHRAQVPGHYADRWGGMAPGRFCLKNRIEHTLLDRIGAQAGQIAILDQVACRQVVRSKKIGLSVESGASRQ